MRVMDPSVGQAPDLTVDDKAKSSFVRWFTELEKQDETEVKLESSDPPLHTKSGGILDTHSHFQNICTTTTRSCDCNSHFRRCTTTLL